MATPEKTTIESGSPHRIYFDSEALEILDAHASAIGPRNRSMVVCALLRALAGLPPRKPEVPIVTQLKKVFGRDQFISFLKAVAEVMPQSAEPLLSLESKNNYEPEAWRIREEVGVLAFYCPTENNIGALFAKASSLKAKHKLTKLFVVTTNGNVVEQSAKKDLAAANIIVLSLADLAATIKHALKLK